MMCIRFMVTTLPSHSVAQIEIRKIKVNKNVLKEHSRARVCFCIVMFSNLDL